MQSSSRSSDAPLPSIGRPLRTGWGDGRSRRGAPGHTMENRHGKVGLWTAVALQSHFRQVGSGPVQADVGASAGLQTHRLPPPQPRQQRTLAQRMGLVPEPPPPPTEEEWKRAEARALRREQEGGPAMRLGNEVCGICLEPFYETLAQGQVILSCSHVFHENCFKQFERFTRVQQREEGADAAVRLACPECRHTHYHKRIFFAGKALAQHAAVVRIQSWVRRYLAEKRYTQLRLRHNTEFRDAYVQRRLANLSQAWQTYTDRQEARQEAVLAALDTKRQAAAAAYLSEEAWAAIIDRCERSAQQRLLLDTLNSSTCASSPLTTMSTVTGTHPSVILHECPICLEVIERDTVGAGPCQVNHHHHSSDGDDAAAKARARGEATATSTETSGEAYVEQMRRDYEQKRDEATKRAGRQARQNGKAMAGQKTKSAAHPARTKTAKTKARKDRATSSQVAATTQQRSQENTAPAPSPPQSTALAAPCGQSVAGGGVGGVEAEAQRGGVILSCGHCFHGACLSVFERYSEWRVLEQGVTYAPPRCPLCRSGYAKHTF